MGHPGRSHKGPFHHKGRFSRGRNSLRELLPGGSVIYYHSCAINSHTVVTDNTWHLTEVIDVSNLLKDYGIVSPEYLIEISFSFIYGYGTVSGKIEGKICLDVGSPGNEDMDIRLFTPAVLEVDNQVSTLTVNLGITPGPATVPAIAPVPAESVMDSGNIPYIGDTTGLSRKFISVYLKGIDGLAASTRIDCISRFIKVYNPLNSGLNVTL